MTFTLAKKEIAELGWHLIKLSDCGMSGLCIRVLHPTSELQIGIFGQFGNCWFYDYNLPIQLTAEDLVTCSSYLEEST